MSGIFGYIGNEDHIQKVKNGLEALHRRGSKNVGITLKCKGELYYANNINAQPSVPEDCTIALAQATDEQINTPACNSLYSVVSDGQIQNIPELSLKNEFSFNELRADEMILKLLTANHQNDKIELIEKLNGKFKGRPTYALISNEEEAIYVSKGNEPLFVGISSNSVYIASELAALFHSCEKYIMLSDGDIAKITQNKISIYDAKGRRAKRSYKAVPDSLCAENNYNYEDEIFYCPLTIKESYNTLFGSSHIHFDKLKINRHMLDKTDRIILTGSGSSYYAAKANTYNFELLTDIESIALPASELKESSGIISKDTLVIAISERGENMDIISAVKRAKYNDARVIAITPNKNSYLALLCNDIIDSGYEPAKEDITFRGFQAEFFALAMLGIYLGFKRGYMTDIHMNVTLKMAQMLSGKISSAIKPQSELTFLSNEFQSHQKIILTGYTVDYAIAEEVASKLREVQAATAYAVRTEEIKNLSDSLVIAIISNEEYANLMIPYLRKIKNNGARLIICTTESIADLLPDFDGIVVFGDSVPLFNPIIIISGLYKAILLSNPQNEKLDEVS